MASYLNELMGGGAAPSGVPTLSQVRRKPSGFIESAFDILARPAYGISEAVGAARAQEDVLAAAWRGLRGKRIYPTLGYQAFPEAQEPGFQPGDIAAFAVDVLTDPLTWAGPGIVKAAAKPISKGLLAAGARLSPKISRILPEFEAGLPLKENMKLLIGEMKNLRMGPEALMKRMEIAAPRDEIKSLFKLARKGKARTKGRLVVRMEETGKPVLPSAKPQGLYSTPIDVFDAELRPELAKKFIFQRMDRKPLDVSGPELLMRHPRGGGMRVPVSGGVKALKKLVGEEEFERLSQLAIREPAALRAEMAKLYPNVKWEKYDDTLEVLEGLGGIKAREAGYDAIVDFAGSEFDEFIALSDKVLRPAGEFTKVTKGTAFRRILEENPWLVDEMRQQMRLMTANNNVTVRGALGSLARDTGTGVMPMLASLRRFGGPAGKQLADKWERALIGGRFDTEKFYGPLSSAAKNIAKRGDKVERIQSVRLREMGQTMRPMVTEKAAKFSDDWGQVVDEMRNDLLNFRDPLGNELRVWNPIRGPRGRWEPFSEHIQPGYYPRVYPKEVYTNRGAKSLYQQLRDKGKTHLEAEGMLARLGHRPTRVGHIEMARLGNEAGYELDPLKVLPKYIYDVMMRKNMAKEFGVNNEILDVLLNDLGKGGASHKYISQVREAITGKNFHDSMWEKLSSNINSFQALAKLGFATSVANFGQGPMNQSMRSGFWNTAQSIVKTAKGERGGLGAVAFSRAAREDIMRGMMGGSSRWMDKYMKMIGFTWTERTGRHMGAIGGELEAGNMARKWLDNVGQAALGNKKAMKEAGRLESELMRKYKVPVSLIDEAGKLPANVLEESGIRAADKTMHAFFPGELPPGWRTPFWRTALQFKSFIYKQSEFMMGEVLGPGLRWFATDGAKGDVMPLLRMLVAMPVGAEAVTHLRDLAKSGPEHIQSLVTEGKFADRDFKEFFWEADSPSARVMSDLTYVGTFGLLGDAIDSAAEGRLWKWAVGPTFADVIEGTEAALGRGDLGQFITREMPGAFGIPYKTDIFESIQRSLRRRKLQ